MNTVCSRRPRFFIPEVVQTSSMDCGPAVLTALLKGFGISASYGRLREACQTGVTGTSIDALEELAGKLGLDVAQRVVPLEHLLLPDGKALPAIVVTKLPGGMLHFVVVWRSVAGLLQIMDPAVGRRWLTVSSLHDHLYIHKMAVPASDFRGFAQGEEFLGVLRRCVSDLGCEKEAGAVIERARKATAWQPVALFDAATRMVTDLVRSGTVRRGREAGHLLLSLLDRCTGERSGAGSIPSSYWTGLPCDASSTDGEELVWLQGAVVLTARPRDMREPAPAGLAPELCAVLGEAPVRPLRELARLLREDGLLRPSALLCGLLASAFFAIVEAVVIRGLVEVAQDLDIVGERLVLGVALVAFFFAVLLLEIPIAHSVRRLGRHLDTRFRIAFLAKLPRLADRYLSSRPTSDMANRSHTLPELRSFPDLGAQLVRNAVGLLVTVVAIAWLDPPSAWLAIVAGVLALGIPMASERVLSERDLRTRVHLGGLSRFYLDALLGLVPIRTHGAERAVRRQHESLLVEWARAARGLVQAALTADTAGSLLGIAFAVLLLFRYVQEGRPLSGLLLFAYWVLDLQTLGQNLAAVARAYPGVRNTALRLIEPLGALEEVRAEGNVTPSSSSIAGVELAFEDVTIYAGGHAILKGIDLRIAPGSEVAIVGSSGAGKSSLVGILLGWHRPVEGRVLVDGHPLDASRGEALRRDCAWVDPAVQLWNRSLVDNMLYGRSESSVGALPEALAAADLEALLERLPDGMQTVLGEGGGLVSGGEGQRIRVGRAMLRRNARLVILDEPFRGLDREKRRALLSRARFWWRGATILCITHDVSETSGFGRVLVVEDGRIVEDDAPATLLRNPSSRYRAMLAAEREVQHGFSGDTWRRLALQAGRLVEEEANIRVVGSSSAARGGASPIRAGGIQGGDELREARRS